jgi:hypothetical protein
MTTRSVPPRDAPNAQSAQSAQVLGALAPCALGAFEVQAALSGLRNRRTYPRLRGVDGPTHSHKAGSLQHWKAGP